MNYHKLIINFSLMVSLFSEVIPAPALAAEKDIVTVNFSASRDAIVEINKLFEEEWRNKGYGGFKVKSYFGGSSVEAQIVSQGAKVDAVVMASFVDIDKLSENSKFVQRNWRESYPNSAVAFTSQIAFVVRNGNPKSIEDWDDLIKPGVSIISPSMTTTGLGRYNYLAAWIYAIKSNAGYANKPKNYLDALLKNMDIVSGSTLAAATEFAESDNGDVLITYESEALRIVNRYGRERFEVVTPSITLETEFPAAGIKRVTRSQDAQLATDAYIAFLFSPTAQKIFSKNYFRPVFTQYSLPDDSNQLKKSKRYTLNEALATLSADQKTKFILGGAW